ncbi:thioredoxin family protein [Ferrimonas futtsuensis]|uniref:thioredoxin family protein n=1 Tax=Ferrimonas futtsuensis TaxID=364764 RepID=UPI00040E3ACD|nr:thioredoxin family protein [Ferrimonas futtsuensis]
MMKRLILGALVMSSGVSAMPGMGNGMPQNTPGANPHGAMPLETAELTGVLTSQQLIFEMIPMGREYLAYQVNQQAMAPIKAVNEPVEILAVLGTWDSTSQQQVPRMMKILKLAENSNISARYIGVDKKGSAGDPELLEGVQVLAFPTFIVRKEGKEIGRIEGAPDTGLEQALVDILK